MTDSVFYYQALPNTNYTELGIIIQCDKKKQFSFKLTNNINDKNLCKPINPLSLPKVSIYETNFKGVFYMYISCDHCKINNQQLNAFFSYLRGEPPYYSNELVHATNIITIGLYVFQHINTRVCQLCSDSLWEHIIREQKQTEPLIEVEQKVQTEEKGTQTDEQCNSIPNNDMQSVEKKLPNDGIKSTEENIPCNEMQLATNEKQVEIKQIKIPGILNRRQSARKRNIKKEKMIIFDTKKTFI